MTEATRPGWDPYFLGIAEAVSVRGDCRRRQVGGIVVREDKTIVATGYNGSRPGGPSCLAGQCPRGMMSKDEVPPGSSYDTGAGSCHAVHDAQNALMRCSWQDLQGSTFYSNHAPCDACLRMLQASGLVRIVWPEGQWAYRPNPAYFGTWHWVQTSFEERIA